MSRAPEPRKRRRPGDEGGPAGAPDRPPRPLATFVGALGGALAALAMGVWEAAVAARAGMPLPAGDLLVLAAALQATVGGSVGLLVGLTRRVGWDFALPWVAGFGAWLVAGKLGMVVAAGGGPAWFAPIVLVPAALGAGLALSSSELPEAGKAGLSGGAFAFLALAVPINQHLLGGPTSTLALVVDAGVLVVALLAAAVTALLGPGVPALGALGPLALAAGLGALALVPVARRPEPPWPLATRDDHPPVVLVVIDTLRADHLGAWGYERPTSPRLDALAREAIVYTQASASASWTLPSVAGLLTGQVAARTGAGVNPGDGSSLSPLRPDAVLLPGRLARAGYVSAAVASNPFLTPAFGFDRGFDRYDGAPAPAAMPGVLHPLVASGFDPWPSWRGAEAITDRALAFVAAQEHRSWFLLVHYMDVHGPHAPAPEDREAVGVGGQGRLIDDYDASVRGVDRQVGRLLDALPQGTWVFVTSDHGEQLLEKRPALAGASPPGTRHGHSLYQEVVHVPLIVDGPGVGARRVDRPVSLLDVTPTILDLVGLPQPERVTGIPLPEIAGGAVPSDRVILADSVRFGPEQQMARQGPYKLIRWHRQGTAMYDLATEPDEREEVSMQEQDAKGIVLRLEAQLAPVGVAGAEPGPPVGAELQMLLERLGYARPEPAPVP